MAGWVGCSADSGFSGAGGVGGLEGGNSSEMWIRVSLVVESGVDGESCEMWLRNRFSVWEDSVLEGEEEEE